MTESQVEEKSPTDKLSVIKSVLLPTRGLSPEERRRFDNERIERNIRRIRIVSPLFVAIQIVLLSVFAAPAEGAAESFRRGIWWIHALTLPINVTISTVAIVFVRKKSWHSWFADVVSTISIYTSVWFSLTTHRLLPTNNSYILILLVSALFLRTTLIAEIASYWGSLVLFVGCLPHVQPSPEVRASFFSTALTAVAMAFALSRTLSVAAVREFRQRLTIEKQQDELRAWNTELEKRVEAQVQEALLREREARALEAQLRMKVRARSQELVQAILEGAPEDGSLPLGSRFEHHFEIERPLGSGAMGDVYQGRDTESDQTVAIKLMRRWDGMSASDVSRFAMEAAATAAVVHPAIVRTYHVDVTAAGRLYLVMEYVSGQTVADALTRGRFSAAQTARFGAVAAEALAVAHRAGVVHRDIKPSNLMLTHQRPGLRILDFGVSKLAVPGNAYKTVAGQIMGTPQYMAPEQILGTAEATGACDVYALGLVMHEMLRGEPTFNAKKMGDVLRAQMSDAPPSLREALGQEMPEDLAQFIEQCLQKDPAARPTAEVLAASLLVIADALHAPPLEKVGGPRHSRSEFTLADSVAPTIVAITGV